VKNTSWAVAFCCENQAYKRTEPPLVYKFHLSQHAEIRKSAIVVTSLVIQDVAKSDISYNSFRGAAKVKFLVYFTQKEHRSARDNALVKREMLFSGK
jgi:hypothetical protein